MTDKPFPDSYWIMQDRFLAGGYPAAGRGDETSTRRRLESLLEAGLDTFIDLTRSGEMPPYQPILDETAARHGVDIDYHRQPIVDRGLPSIDQMVSLLDFIDTALAAGRKIYLHCLGGIGRTGTTVGCWLVRHGLTGETALARLNVLYRTSEQSSYFPRSPEMDAQVLFILDWKETFSSSRLSPREKDEGLGFPWHTRFLQQAGWTRDLRGYLFEQAGLAQAQRVLEVGCGTGAILSGLSTTATVHGLDFDLARLAEAALHAPQAVLVCGDALHLPYPAAAFDITFCHFLLLWLPDPLQALLEMARLTRPGGYVLALAEPDYDARVDKPESLASLGRWQAESLRRQGADAGLGARLAELFCQAGIPIIETGRLHDEADTPPTLAERDLEWAVLEADLAGLIPPQEIHRLKLLEQQAWGRGNRVLFVPTYFAWGRVKGV